MFTNINAFSSEKRMNLITHPGQKAKHLFL